MKRIKKTAAGLFLISLGLIFLFSCASVDQQTPKGVTEPPKKTPAVSSETKPPTKPQVQTQPQTTPKEVKDLPQKAPAKSGETQPPPKATSKPPVTRTPAIPGETTSQQTYYDMGMRYYSQEKYVEAKKSWERVIKLGRRTPLADKARENIKKTEQILKTLKEMSDK
jgi:outer membrane biosynthesis protein TonB